MRNRMPVLIATAWLLVQPAAPALHAHAADWVFRRSYYSHAIPPELQADYPVPESRSAYRPALTGTTPGLAVRGGYRFNRIFLRNGNSTDSTIIYEAWFNVRP